MDPMDAILITIEAAGKDEITGRTAIQKLIYLEKKKVDIAAKFIAYHYGPYSTDVNGALQTLVSLNLITEEIDYGKPGKPDKDGWVKIDDYKVYKYKLTKNGQMILKRINKRYGQEKMEIDEIVKQCKQTVNLNRHKLACTAKIDYIKTNFGDNLTDDEIISKAKSFGWELTFDDISIGSILIGRLN